MTDTLFRAATMADLASLLKLEQKIVDAERPFDASIRKSDATYYDLEKLISDDESYLLVVEVDGTLIGTGYAQIRASKECFSHDRHCYLGFIYLEPGHRGMSLGQKILDNLKGWGLEQGLRHFHLDVYSENISAIRAYEKAGFNTVSVHMELIE